MHVFMRPAGTEDTLISVSNLCWLSHTASQHLRATSARGGGGGGGGPANTLVIATPVAHGDVCSAGAPAES